MSVNSIQMYDLKLNEVAKIATKSQPRKGFTMSKIEDLILFDNLDEEYTFEVYRRKTLGFKRIGIGGVMEQQTGDR